MVEHKVIRLEKQSEDTFSDVKKPNLIKTAVGFFIYFLIKAIVFILLFIIAIPAIIIGFIVFLVVSPILLVYYIYLKIKFRNKLKSL